MSLFGDLDIASADDDPFAIPDNTYDCYLTDVKVAPTKNGDKTGMTLIYTIDDGAHKGKQIQEWRRIPDAAHPQEDDERAKSYLKSRMLSLGVPENRINSVTADDLIGAHVHVTVKNSNGYTNVRKVALVPASTSANGAVSFE